MGPSFPKSNMTADKNDWRLRGQDRYLAGVELLWKHYGPYSRNWEHDHCAFCWRKFSTAPDDFHEGYTTADYTNWVCKDCYEDFKEMFKWTVAISG